ncbi:SMC5-SMC6 complex localization factor protein 2 isoform X2 [Hyperolius riggenbachi]|uniref:SMC5-SMC6 complex localization factor protein 2 isoform X2 n=1 Tax=Hyperolius riggenbachi TaxID=752182 RepID=UPI0035A31407
MGGSRCRDRNHHITDFFKQACKPDVFSLAPKVPVGMECLQSADVNSSSSPRSPPSKIRRTCLSPSTSSGRPIMEVFQRSMTDDQAVVRNLQVFCTKCGVSLLSPKVVIERLTLPISSQLNLTGEIEKCSDETKAAIESSPSIKRRLRSRHLRSQAASGKSPCNQKSFNNRRQTTVNGSKTNGTSVRNEVTSVDLSSSGSEEEGNNELPRFVTSNPPDHTSPACSTPDISTNGLKKSEKKKSQQMWQDSLDSNSGSEDEGNDELPRFVTSNPPDHTSPAFSTPDISTNGLKKSEKKKSQRMWRDSLDSDDESLHICYSSSDEAEETLQPLDQILQMAKQPFPATPQKEELSMLSLSQSSLPDTPVAKRLQQLPPTPSYDNNLECLVKEKEESERIDEMERRLQRDLEMGKGMADEVMDSGEEGELTDEHRAFLNKFKVNTNSIPDHPPGEAIFQLSESGAIFSQHTLNLQHSNFSADSPQERILFNCSPENQLMLATEGFVTTLYQFKKCPEILMKWMFQMVSVHPSYTISMKLLNTLIEITCNHLTNLEETPWTPTLLDIATVFVNMGVHFSSLFPFPLIQPSFTAADLVSAIQSSVSGTACAQPLFSHVPEFNIAHVIKFLNFCTAIYRETFHDCENLALLVMLLKIHLEKDLKDLPVMDLHCLVASLLQNIKDWGNIMRELWYAMSELSDHHHNFIKVLQLVPTFDPRGRDVRRHVSLIFISNILNGDCETIPLDYGQQMRLLSKCMSQMKPSLLLKKMQQLPENEAKPALDLDQEAYYLTFSLLHLVNDASTSDESPFTQRKYLQKLCSELDRHIKSDIREDARFFYRTKVKDLVARIHGRWQELLLYSRPNQGKLHDYWQPMCDSSSSQSSQECISKAPQENALLTDNK